MSTSSTHRLASPAAGVLIALLLLLALIPLTMGSAAADTVRVEGDTNVEVAVEYSQLAFPTGATAAFVGRDDDFPDNLASGGGQGLLNAPLLLTDGEALSPETATELERLGATEINILGGTNAVSQEVEVELTDLGYTVERLAGETRLETAIDVAETLFPTATTAILARAYAGEGDPTQAFADSLAAGGWAADAEFPVLLSQTELLSDSTEAYIDGSAIENVFLVGGTAALSEQVQTDLEALDVTVTRIEGPTRFDTAVAIAAERGFETSADAQTTILVEGQDANAWASGFPAAALADRANAPIVLANGETLPPATIDFLVPDEAGGTESESESECAPGATDPPVPLPDSPLVGACPSESGSPGPTPTGGVGGEAVLVCGAYVTEAACEAAAAELGIEPAGSPSASDT